MHTSINFLEENKDIVRFQLHDTLPIDDKNSNAIELFLNNPTILKHIAKKDYETFSYIENENTPFETELIFFNHSFDFPYNEHIEEIIDIYQETFNNLIMTTYYWSKENTVKRLYDTYHNIKPAGKIPQHNINEDEIPF